MLHQFLPFCQFFVTELTTGYVCQLDVPVSSVIPSALGNRARNSFDRNNIWIWPERLTKFWYFFIENLLKMMTIWFKVHMMWKICSAYLKGLSKYRRMTFFILKYPFLFERYWCFTIMQIRSVMTPYRLQLKSGKILNNRYLWKYCSSVLETWHHNCAKRNKIALLMLLP